MTTTTDGLPPYKETPLEDLVPYARNARTHTQEQIEQIAASIREFGFLNPVIVDDEGGIIAGHARVQAARKLGRGTVPTIEASHLTEAQKRAYILADNRLAELAGWDDELLRVELGELRLEGVALELTGFDEHWLGEPSLGDENDAEPDSVGENPYVSRPEAPVYEPRGEPPALSDVYDAAKAQELIADIEASGLSEEEKQFLRFAAYRHVVIDFEAAADYYAHASAECQRLMEDNALVIVDFDRAISEGFVSLSEQIAEQYRRDHPEDFDDEA